MCGICGIVYRDKKRVVQPEMIERMTNVLSHRGPDDSGQFIDNNVAFGHRRLSIVDVEHGHQPMSSVDKKLWITFNGEIYNHIDLRRDLDNRGYRHHTRCDTETLINCLDAYGTAGLHKLYGMFAFALYDRSDGRIFLARDRLGIKPLYYVETEELFAFASEIKSLLEIPGIKRRIDFRALTQILAHKYTCDDSTLFEGIKKLEPGHYLEYVDGTISTVRYWDCSHVQVDNQITETDAITYVGSMVDESIILRLMADVPLGMFLSGGLDSTIISGRMSKIIEQKISTFSVAFAEQEANELYYAKLAAAHVGADYHQVMLSAEEFFSLIPRLVYHEDEPIAHPSSIALYKVSELARNHVKVVLTGEGSDELFGGYDRYYQTLLNIKVDKHLFALVPRSARRRLIRPILDALPYRFPMRNKAMRTSLYLDADFETIYLDNFATFSRSLASRLIGESKNISIDRENFYSGYLEHFNRSSSTSFLSRMLYADVKTYLVELLMKQDQMSMAASIESRVPFLDHRLVEFAFSLPDKFKIQGKETKRILRESYARQVPRSILHRSKQGFPVPIRRWFAGEYARVAKKYIFSDGSFSREHFDMAFIEKLFEHHQSSKYNYEDQIWLLLNFEFWYRIFILGEKWQEIDLTA